MNKEWVVDVNVPPQELEARLNGREGYLLYAIYYDGDATFTLVWRREGMMWYGSANFLMPNIPRMLAAFPHKLAQDVPMEVA